MTRNWSLVGMSLPALAALGAFVLGGGAPPVAAQDGSDDCEAERCAAQSAIDAACPCEEATSHGRYVRCVTRATKDLVSKSCRDEIIRCAARSTCGRDEGAVTCLTPELGKCNHPSNTCAHDPSISCQNNKDCVASTRCRVRGSADECVAKGGTVGTGTSCCAPCPGGTQCCVQSSAMGAFDACILVSPAECTAQSGIDVGAGSCDPNPCPPVVTTSTSTTAPTSSSTTVTVTSTTTTTEPTTQCCVQGSAMGAFDNCALLTASACATAGGINVGSGACDPNPCPPSTTTTTMIDRCCVDGACLRINPPGCFDAGGTPIGDGSCDPNPCPTTTSTTIGTTSTTEATTTSTTTTSSSTSTTFSMVGAFLDLV
jgi:hypothetical protein